MSVRSGSEIILRDICRLVDYGYTASSSVEPIGPKFLRITDIVPDLIDWDSVPHCEIEDSKYDKYRLKQGDIVIARTGATTGYGKWIKDPHDAVFASYLVRLRVIEEVDSRFVGYIVESTDYKKFIEAHRGGAAQPNANAQVLTSYPVKLPALDVQRRIATILSAYDDLIENNTRRIAILEEMARAIYREWFVGFRFPGHEQVEMVESGLGPVPAGWAVGQLQDALLLQRGFDLPTKQRREGGIPVYASTGVVGHHDEAKVKGPGVVTGRSGSLGTVTYIESDFWPLNTTLWVKEFRRATPLYAYYLLSGVGLEGYNSGAAVPTLNRNDVHGLSVVLPSGALLAKFDSVVQPMHRLSSTLRKHTDNLRSTRDLLLPRLISGEIAVSAVEEDLAGAAA